MSNRTPARFTRRHAGLTPAEAVLLARLRSEPYFLVLFEGKGKEPYDLRTSIVLEGNEEAQGELCMKLELIAMRLRRGWAMKRAKDEQEREEREEKEREGLPGVS